MARAEDRRGSAGNVIAAVCSFFIPGLGQLVQGRVLAAAFYFVTVSVCVWISPITLFLSLIPAGLLWLFSILAAATFRPK